jgi:hypothetical protein
LIQKGDLAAAYAESGGAPRERLKSRHGPKGLLKN